MTEEKKWKRLGDFQSFRTSEQKEMVGKYLASRVIKTWNEDFRDEDTGEIVSIERNEVLFEKNTYITQEVAQQIMFSIQSEEIKDVEVGDEPNPRPFMIENVAQVPYEVKMSGKKYIVYAQTVAQAIEIAAEYAAIYLEMAGQWFSVGSVRRIDANIIDEEDPHIVTDEPAEENEPADEQQMMNVADIHYYQATVRTYKLKGHKMKHDDYHYILPSQTIEQANQRMKAIAADRFHEYIMEDPEKHSYKVLGAKPYQVDGIVPKSYSKMFWYKVD